jgi:acetyl esterase/lipase
VIGGESAGGGLAAATALFARDKKIADICLQIPLYPMIDDRDTDTSANNTAPVWNTFLNHAAWKVYLGELYGADKIGKYAAPARASNLSGLPPAITFIGTIEPFYAETVQYFRRLEQAGVPTELMMADGCFHAFDMLAPSAGISKEAVRFALNAYDKYIEQI